MNDGRGGFDTPVHLNQGAQPTAVAAADFTGDGRPDLAVANEHVGNGIDHVRSCRTAGSRTRPCTNPKSRKQLRPPAPKL